MTPLPASTVMPLRDGRGGLEVLMVRRPEKGAFGGAYVFPGGKVDPVDRGPDAALAVTGIVPGPEREWRAAALRELAEEVGIFLTNRPFAPSRRGLAGADVYRAVHEAGARLDAGRLVYVSNWVTPPGSPVRFDTRFYAASVDEGVEPVPCEGEVTDALWTSPDAALGRGRRGEWSLILPTIKHLEMLAGVPGTSGLTALRGPSRAAPVEPRLVRRGGRLVVLLPGEEGSEAAPA